LRAIPSPAAAPVRPTLRAEPSTSTSAAVCSKRPTVPVQEEAGAPEAVTLRSCADVIAVEEEAMEKSLPVVRAFAFQVNGFSVAAVFDGHVGDAASEYMIRNLIPVLKAEMNKTSQMQKVLFNTVKELEFSYSGKGYTSIKDKGYENHLKELPNIPGTTAVICVIDKNNMSLYVANVGDSRAILVRKGRSYQITGDHSMHIIGPETFKLFERDKSAYVKEGYLWTTN
jgi:hypothetical protein